MATDTLLFLISSNSFTPFVKTENRKNTAAFINTAATNPISKYSSENLTIVKSSIPSEFKEDNLITLVIEGKISLKISPIDNTNPEIKTERAILSF